MYDQIDGGAQNYVVFSFASRQNGGQTYTLQNADGETVGTWTPANDFTCLVVSSPDLTAGTTPRGRETPNWAGTMSDGVGSPGGGRHMGGEAPPADLDPWQAPEGEVPENASSEVPGDPPERPDGEMEPDGRGISRRRPRPRRWRGRPERRGPVQDIHFVGWRELL